MNITGFKYREPLIIITIIKCSHIREEEQKNNPQSKRQTSLWSANSQRLRLLFKLNRKMSKFTVQKRKKYLCTDTIESQKYNKQRTRILQGFV